MDENEKAKRKQVPVRPGLILWLGYAPVLTTLLLAAIQVLVTGRIPFTDIVIFPLLTPQIQAWVFMFGFIVLPIVILGSLAWLYNLYRTWNEISLTVFQKILLAIPALVIPAAMVALACATLILAFMYGDTHEVRGTLALGDKTYHLVEVYSYKQPDEGRYVLYACEPRGILCKVAARTEATDADFVRMTQDSGRIKLVFTGGRQTSELTYYPF